MSLKCYIVTSLDYRHPCLLFTLSQLQENSVIDLLVAASEGTGEGKGMSDNEIISNCLIFLFAAYDTTSLTLTCLSHLLATNPHIQNKLCSLLDEYWSQHMVM